MVDGAGSFVSHAFLVTLFWTGQLTGMKFTKLLKPNYKNLNFVKYQTEQSICSNYEFLEITSELNYLNYLKFRFEVLSFILYKVDDT